MVTWRRHGVGAIGALALCAGCANPGARPAVPRGLPDAPRTIRVQVVERGATAIRQVPFEEYVQATTLSEFAPPSGNAAIVERMLEVQSVISRTWTLAHFARHSRSGFNVCATTHCQLFDAARLRTSRWAPAALRAVTRTAGSVLWFRDTPAQAFFHADCGGRTSDAADVWGGDRRPYLPASQDDGPAASAHAEWTFEAPHDRLVRALDADPRTRVGGRLERLEVVARDSAGRAQLVALTGRLTLTARGEHVREALTRAFGARAVRSTWFDVTRNGSTFIFSGRGFGHGVGLCQAGAYARLNAGAKPGDVLKRYFPGTRLRKLPT